ncbi:FAD-dependent monooxygenase [Halovulum marinum]|nr:FAD-dependent monooxygenase [Halovulum marinum]
MIRTAAVVGAGIGGMAAALSLARRGVAVTVHERAPAFDDVGAGLQIGPNGVHVLRALGLGAELDAHAARPRAVEMRDGLSGRLVAAVDMAAAEGRYGAPYLQLHRADLLAVLTEAATGAGATLRFASEIDPGAPPQADAVIAADGVRSAFRRRALPDVAPAFTGQVAWRALVPHGAAADGLDPGRTLLFMGPGRHVVVYPLRGGALWNLVAVEARDAWTAEGWTAVADVERMRAGFAGWCAPVTRLLAAVGEGREWGLFAHGALPRWHRGNVALLGDACHPMLPFLAQGATMAIEDAWVLADCLERHGDVPAALAAYERARKPRVTRVQRAAARNARLYHLPPGPLRAGLRAGMAGVGALAPGGLLARFDWLYGHDVTGGAG